MTTRPRLRYLRMSCTTRQFQTFRPRIKSYAINIMPLQFLKLSTSCRSIKLKPVASSCNDLTGFISLNVKCRVLACCNEMHAAILNSQF